MTASNEGPPPASTVPIILLLLLADRFALNDALDNLLNVANFDEDVFGLEIGVDYAAFPVEVIEAQQDLLGDLLDKGHRNASVVPPLDETKEVLSQNLKNHANMGAVGALVFERVEQTHDVFATRVFGFGLDDAVEKLNLVDGRLGIVGGGSHNLEGDVLGVGVVAG